MKITDVFMSVTVRNPLTNEIIEEHIFSSVVYAADCFNEMCEDMPLAVVELGVFTFCENHDYDSHKVVKSNR